MVFNLEHNGLNEESESAMSKELALYLAQERIVARWQMANAVEVYDLYPDSLCDNLVRLNYLDETTYLNESSEFYGVEIVSGDRLTAVPARILQLLPRDVAARHKVLPLAVAKNVLTCAVKLPVSMAVLQQMRLFTGYNIQPVITRHEALRDALARFYSIEIPPLTVSDQVREKYEKRRPMAEGDVSDVAALTTGTVIPEVRNIGKGPAVPMGERNAVKMKAVAAKVDAALTHDEPGLELDREVQIRADKIDSMLTDAPEAAAAVRDAALTLPPGDGPIELTPNYAMESESSPTSDQSIELEPLDDAPASLELVSEPDIAAMPVEEGIDLPQAEPPSQPQPEPEPPRPIPDEPPAPAPAAPARQQHAGWGSELDALNEMLSEASKTDEIIETALDFLSERAARVIFMAMKKKQITGHSGRGLSDELIRQCVVDYSLISLVRAAVENVQPYVGQPFEDDAIGALVEVIGNRPSMVAVIPVHIKDKPVGLLYLDDAGDGPFDMDHGFATNLRKLISAAFETLILARKLGV